MRFGNINRSSRGCGPSVNMPLGNLARRLVGIEACVGLPITLGRRREALGYEVRLMTTSTMRRPSPQP